ncbi:MAG: DHH family phosphoesterase [Puniceicoccales bacterium]|jgi:phosphoesterase RecJ-like protein|nr:DHH family phosphoesterase [Puniceicoccales bacterium]
MSESKLYFPEASAMFRKLMDSLKGKRVVVMGHMRPDGDCIGSQVAMCRFLRYEGIDAICVNHHYVPKYLLGFVGDTPFIHESDFIYDGREAVCTDCADLTRTGKELRGMMSWLKDEKK